MTASPAILDADMATVGRWARSGFAWWIEELTALVPAKLKHALAGKPAIDARFDGSGFKLSRRGVAITRADAGVALVLPADAALVRQVQLPLLGAGDTRRLLALEADRLLPFAPGTALIDHAIGAPGTAGQQWVAVAGQQWVAVAGLPLAAAETAMAAASAHGLDVRQLRIADGAGGARFDFLADWPRAGESAGSRARRFWWGAVACGLFVNLAALIGRDIISLRQTEELVASHGEAAATARQLRGRVLAEDAQRRSLLQRRAAQDPLPVLAATTRALPDTAWVQRLSWDGQALRLAGYKQGNFDVVAALRAEPLFASVRSTSADVAAQISARQPFEITAERHK